MTISVSPPPVPAKRVYERWIITIGVILVWWALLISQQRLEWMVNPVYSYGWAMPVLVGYLFWMRWMTRPEVEGHLPKGALAIGVAILLLTWLPLRVIHEANPDWVKVNWSINGLWVSFVFLIFARCGGIKFALHFLYPLLFSFVALPWPVWMEESMMQWLMKANALVCADVLTFLGTPAMAVGNLIQVAGNWVNVEEACSGITSLQTAFMMGLFLGEFLRFSLGRRITMMVGAFAVAVFVNVVRTIILAFFAKTNSVANWHDTVGNIGMIVCLLAIGGVAWLISLRRKKTVVSIERGPLPIPSERSAFSRYVAFVIIGWLGAVELATHGWYRAHESALPPPVPWNVNLPRGADDFEEGEFGDRALALLKFNHGVTASWKSEFGHSWQMYFLEWEPGRVSKFLSSSHYPTVCLPATGLSLVAETGVWVYRSGSLEIPFTTYLFDEHGKEVYVFHSVIEDIARTEGTRLAYRQVNSDERIRSVLLGERNLGQRVIGIAIRGPYSPVEARLVMETSLAKILSVGSQEETR